MKAFSRLWSARVTIWKSLFYNYQRDNSKINSEVTHGLWLSVARVSKRVKKAQNFVHTISKSNQSSVSICNYDTAKINIKLHVSAENLLFLRLLCVFVMLVGTHLGIPNYIGKTLSLRVLTRCRNTKVIFVVTGLVTSNGFFLAQSVTS